MTQRQRLIVGVLAALWLVLPAAALAQQLVFVVRHAERADAGSATATTMGADPPLSALGEARAAKLASMLADSGIQAVFSTEYKRTQDTAKPLAAKLGLTVQSSPAVDTAGLVARIKSGHAADVVLVVGHSNTVPAILKAFGGPDVTIGDNEYDNLFIIVPATGAMTRIRF
jgi:broad specificity phosphatase PhoE